MNPVGALIQDACALGPANIMLVQPSVRLWQIEEQGVFATQRE